MATKKRTTKRTMRNLKSSKQMRSFRVEKDTIPFTYTRPTIQTVYWLLLLASIVVLEAWILQAQMAVSTLSNYVITTL
jgi:hypothetical protein